MTAPTNPPDSKTPLPSGGGVASLPPDPALLQLRSQMRRLRVQEERLAEKLSQLSAGRDSRTGRGRALAGLSAADLERWLGAWTRQPRHTSNTDTDDEPLHTPS